MKAGTARARSLVPRAKPHKIAQIHSQPLARVSYHMARARARGRRRGRRRVRCRRRSFPRGRRESSRRRPRREGRAGAPEATAEGVDGEGGDPTAGEVEELREHGPLRSRAEEIEHLEEEREIRVGKPGLHGDAAVEQIELGEGEVIENNRRSRWSLHWAGRAPRTE